MPKRQDNYMSATNASLADFPSLHEAVEGQVPANHFFTKALQQHAGPLFLRWLDDRYQRVFGSDRLEWDGQRRTSIRRQLRDPIGFWNTDAEVQTAATILACQATRLRANDESGIEGVRSSDYLILSPRPIDVEVRILQEDQNEQERAKVSKSIASRLRRLVRNGYSITVKVAETRGSDETFVVTPKVEKDIVDAVYRVLRAKPQRKECVIVHPNGVAEQWGGGSLHGMLVYVDIAPSSSHIVLEYGGLRAPPGTKEAERAIKKKLGHKQRSGERPWVIVLDSSGAHMMDFEEIEIGLQRAFSNSTSLSAAVVQRRQILLDEIVPGPDSPQTILFESRIFVNPKARIPITQEEMGFFEALEKTRHFGKSI